MRHFHSKSAALVLLALPVMTLSVMALPIMAQPVFAQAIQTDTLGAARAFDAGALGAADSGLGLDLGAGLWTGTGQEQATALIEAAPIKSDTPIIRDLVRAALLSAGEPPSGDRDAFEAARLRAVLTLGDEAALSELTRRNPALAQSPAFRAQSALAQDDAKAACAVSDQVSTGRAEPEWARLRIVCHVLRGEIAAAELTRDLLQNSGYKEANYFALLSMMIRAQNSGAKPSSLPPTSQDDDALIDFMRGTLSKDDTNSVDKSLALDSTQPAQARLDALWANVDNLDVNEMSAVMSDIAFDVNDIAGSSTFDLASASARNDPLGTGQLFMLARSGGREAMDALIARAPFAVRGDLRAKLRESFAPLSAADMVEEDLAGFTQMAINKRDIPALQALYQALDGDKRQDRIALATDSIGNGFNYGPLGSDIDTRLTDPATKTRARRDAMLALAMGAQISADAKTALAGYNFSDGRTISDGDRVVLEHTAKAGSRAELALRMADILDGRRLDTPSLSFLIEVLQAAGLPQFAGRLAAEDFVSDL